MHDGNLKCTLTRAFVLWTRAAADPYLRARECAIAARDKWRWSRARRSRTLRASRMGTAVATLSRGLQTSIINVLTAHRSPRNQPGHGRFGCKDCWARSVGHTEARTRRVRTGANWSTNWTPREAALRSRAINMRFRWWRTEKRYVLFLYAYSVWPSYFNL